MNSQVFYFKNYKNGYFMKKILSLICVASISFDACALTLTEALVSAYNNNQELIAKREELKFRDEEMSKAISTFLPDVKFTVSKTNQKDNRFSDVFDTNTTTQGWAKQKSKTNSLTLEQNLFAGGASLIALQAAKYQINVYRGDLIKTEQDVLINSINAFNNVIYSQNAININKSNVEALSSYLVATKQRFDAGLATKTEVATAEANLEDAKSKLISASGAYVDAIADFRQRTGTEPENLVDIFAPEDLPHDLDEVIKLSQKHNPDIIIAKNSELRAGLDVNSAISAMLPSLNLSASVSSSKTKDNRKQSFNPFIGTSERIAQISDNARRKDITVGIALTVPIYNKGQEYSRIRGARSLLSKAKADYRSAVDKLNNISTQNWIEHQTNLSSLQAQQRAEESYKIALDGLINEYQEGVKPLEDLLQVRSRFFQTQLGVLDAKRRIVISAYKIKAITGKLNAKDLGLPTKLYDPSLNYNKTIVKLVGF